MKKVILSVSALCLVAMLQSCGETKMDPAAVEAQVNSLASSKIEAATASATAECETRMTTDLKRTTDSIVNAMQMAQAAQ